MNKSVKTVIGVGIVIAVQSTAVLGDDYKEATEAAYCVGVHQNDVEFWRRTDPKSVETRDAEMKQSGKQTFVEGAIKRRIIDRVTVSKMRAVGYADAKSCLEQSLRCTQQWSDKMDEEQNNRVLENCRELAEPVCERAYKNCEY
jgi:hypothetical protein